MAAKSASQGDAALTRIADRVDLHRVLQRVGQGRIGHQHSVCHRQKVERARQAVPAPAPIGGVWRWRAVLQVGAQDLQRTVDPTVRRAIGCVAQR